MRVLIPSALRSYTQGQWAEAVGDSLDAVLHDLDRQHPGFRFRMVDEQGGLRPHMRVFVHGFSVHQLSHPLKPTDDIAIVQALSGG